MNEQLNRTRNILCDARYQCIRQVGIAPLTPTEPATKLEWWAGKNGVVILQHADPRDGVQTYANWPLGHTFAELEAALK